MSVDLETWIRELYREKNNVHNQIEELDETSLDNNNSVNHKLIRNDFENRIKIIKQTGK